MNHPNKLQEMQSSMTKKQRVLLLVIAVVVVLGLLTATVFRNNAASFLALDSLLPAGGGLCPQRPV